jgi:glycerol-3-phosphate O-acyltransferase
MSFIEELDLAYEEQKLSQPLYDHLLLLYTSYRDAILKRGGEMSAHEGTLVTFLHLVLQQLHFPFQFHLYNPMVQEPFDYYKFGLDFLLPLINENGSRVWHQEIIRKIWDQLNAQENAILFGNHQTEVDPQLIRWALEKEFPQLAHEIIVVAGHRVTTDPMAVPFSLGCNLLCIFSKRHIDHPPEKKGEKLQHNQKTMQRMKELLATGGKCIYVAPAGGRDRPNEEGEVHVAPFDPHSIEMFRLMAEHSKKKTHFYPLALFTYDMLPPPRTVEKELGEARILHYAAIAISFCEQLKMENLVDKDVVDKHRARSLRAHAIWQLVSEEYLRIREAINR